MFHVILFQPEIPPNTGNIIRLCANTGSDLHLIEPLGFDLEHAKLRRAGLDYHELAAVHVHPNLAGCLKTVAPGRVLACTTRATRRHTAVCFQVGDALLFGPETRGLPDPVLDGLNPEQCLRIPMVPGSRSLNLSNAVAVVLYEAWRQHDFTSAR